MSKANFKGKGKATATDFVGFHFERPSQPNPTTSNANPRKSRKAVVASATKAESVHASLRFIVSALSNPLESAWYDPDTLIPWECVECVVVPLNQENTLLCPICLDTVQCPRITKCGHTFCVTCLLRHMQSDRSNALKCPMCMEYIFQNDLRHALFMYDHMDTEDAVLAMAAVGDIASIHPFYVFKPFRGHLTQTFSQIQHQLQHEAQQQPPLSQTPSSSSTASSLKLRQSYTFHHLVVEKGNCRPHLPSKLLHKLVSTPLSTVLPTPSGGIINSNSSASTVPGMNKRTSTNASGGFFGTGSLSEQVQTLSTILPNELSDEEARFAKIMYRPLPYSLSRACEEETLMLTWQEKMRSEGDTEMLPFLQQAIELLHQSTQTLLTRVASAFSLDQPDIIQAISHYHHRTPIHIKSPTVDVLGGAVVPPHSPAAGFATILDNDTLYTHVYQSIHGDMVFLHPLCLRALQAECHHRRQRHETAETLPETVTGSIVDMEYLRLGATARDKPTYLRHLPAFSPVTLVELDMKRLLSKAVYEQFAGEFHKRSEKRREKKKQEVKHERSLAHKHRQREAARQQVYYQPFSSDDWCGDDMAYATHFPSDAATGFETPAVVAPVPNTATPGSRFAEITQMHGHFPSLTSTSSSTPAVSGQSTPLPPAPPTTRSTDNPSPSTTTADHNNNNSNNNNNNNRNNNNSTNSNKTAQQQQQGNKPSSLSLVANQKPRSTGTSSTSISSIRSQTTSVSSISSSSASSTTANNGMGGFTFTLEEALKQSRGRVQSKQQKQKKVLPNNNNGIADEGK